MAPTDSSVVDELKSTIDKLQAKVQDLESRLHGGASPSGSSNSDGMRMILMGPPGAGKANPFPPKP